MRQILLFAAPSLLFATPTLAQQFEGERVLRTFERADFLATLAELGATATPIENQNNIQIEFSNGMKADGVLMACDDETSETNCYGTSILATFGSPEDGDNAAIVEAINTYNFRENFGRAFIDQDGTIQLRMYIISDGGITMENYRRQIQLWTASAEDFFGYLYGED